MTDILKNSKKWDFPRKSTCGVRMWYHQNKLADIRECVYSRYMGEVSYIYVVY
jgi:hypothetical protein